MNKVEEWILENKDKIEKAFKLLGQAIEVLAATVGQIHPLLEAVFLLSAEILKTDGTQAKFLAEQFEKINEKLKGIQDEIDQTHLEMLRSTMNKQNFDFELKIISQYEKFLDYFNDTTKFREKEKEEFISHYENTGRDLNIDALYNAVTGKNFARDAILDTIVTIEQRSRKPVEEFCGSLKKIFFMGIIAVVSHAAIKNGAVDKNILKKWQDRFEDIEKRMKAAVDDCIKNFHLQAKMDVERQLPKGPVSVHPEFAKSILDILEKKYYWVSWSVQVVNHSGGFFLWNWLAGKKYHGSSGGGNFFDLVKPNSIRIVVSFSADPKPINKSQLLDQIEAQEMERNMESVAQTLWKTLPNTVVHAISCYKKVEEKNNFQAECFFFGKHKNAYLCIHSE